MDLWIFYFIRYSIFLYLSNVKLILTREFFIFSPSDVSLFYVDILYESILNHEYVTFLYYHNRTCLTGIPIRKTSYDSDTTNGDTITIKHGCNPHKILHHFQLKNFKIMNLWIFFLITLPSSYWPEWKKENIHIQIK